MLASTKGKLVAALALSLKSEATPPVNNAAPPAAVVPRNCLRPIWRLAMEADEFDCDAFMSDLHSDKTVRWLRQKIEREPGRSMRLRLDKDPFRTVEQSPAARLRNSKVTARVLEDSSRLCSRRLRRW